MSQKLVDECDSCGRQVVKRYEGDSSDMILGAPSEGSSICYLLYLCDIRLKETGRPIFSLVGRHWCPDCFLSEITKWINILKARPHSRGVE